MGIDILIVIPMGIDHAPFIANLFLYFYFNFKFTFKLSFRT